MASSSTSSAAAGLVFESAPKQGKFEGYDHLHFWVANAKQVASWYCLRFGFVPLAYRGLETGSRQVATHVIKNNEIIFAFSSPLTPVESEMGKRVAIKGDAVKDVAFRVKDCTGLFKKAVEKGAKVVMPPTEFKDDNGRAIVCTVGTYGDTVHSFVERDEYTGPFLPGYVKHDKFFKSDPLLARTNTALPTGLAFVDHIVGNQPDLRMEEASNWYEHTLNFHRFWSVDESILHTEYSALRSIVMADPDEKIKMPINEPAPGKRKSQIQEYIDYHGEAGVQHIALNTKDILSAITNLRERGVEFLQVPHTYYEDVRKRLAKSPLKVKESLEEIEKLNILIDFDDHGYLLQLFTKPVEDRPTLFFEIIQRNGHSGFGAGNFKALFEAIERDQHERGNLI